MTSNGVNITTGCFLKELVRGFMNIAYIYGKVNAIDGCLY